MTDRTIYCTDLDQMIDYAAAFADGGWSGLQKAVAEERKQRQMPDYDNSNRLALWSPRNSEKRRGYYTGGGPNTDFNGQQVNNAVLTVCENTRDKGPYAELWWELADGTCRRTAIFNNKGKLGGKIDGWWVNVFKNDKGAPLTVKFNQMEAKQPAGAGKTGPVDEDEIPF